MHDLITYSGRSAFFVDKDPKKCTAGSSHGTTARELVLMQWQVKGGERWLSSALVQK